ncbi:Cytochrome P450 302a1, mitochondrial [Araneus ventricosus]|uniref:Cytochrome P450 302a1, mitochondrial n=1 Tax=Araneus ventricosus TaxID=182803 RepID=A0A4Y2I402_ARAVE|nr:Cytochrome P450 302a1, mitochondrial [Araneus ventricosus]
MIVLCGKQVSQKLCAGAWRTFVSKVKKEPYWRAKFPDRIASFDEIPTVTEKYDLLKYPEVAEGWFKKNGHVVKEPMPYGKYNVHLFHFEDFRTVYHSDGDFPIRRSHHVIAQYREERKNLYDHVGLGPGQGAEWCHLRDIARGKAFALRPSKRKSEDAANDLVEIIKNNLNEKGEIELLPWLHRWAFESIGIVALNRRLNALSKVDNELTDKMVAAAALTDELIALTTLDPTSMHDERFKQLVEAQDFFYSVLRKYIDAIKRDIELEPETEGVAQILLQSESCSENDAITLIIDLFHGALQAVPLTALMAFYNVARNGDVQAEAREETKQRMPKKDSRYFDVTEPQDYIGSIVYETLRLNPPIIGNGRVIQRDLVLGGYSVPAYTNVILHFQVACRQEENYEEPLKFIPGRADPNRITYIFGGSKRMCLGKAFALRQLLLVVAKVIRNFELFYDGGEINMINQLHNRPDKPLILRLKPIDE